MKKLRKIKTIVTTFGIWSLIILSSSAINLQSVFGQKLKIPSTRPQQAITGVSDNRVLVADTKKFPFSAIVKLIVKFPDGTTATGSGALIGPNKVITADHVVFDADSGEHAESIEVLPGYANDYTSCKRTYMKSFKHGSHNGCHEGANCDLAVITTQDSLGCDTGWFGYREFDESDLDDVFIAGYPADLSNGQRMYFLKTSASHLRNQSQHNILSYRDWTYGGMSGGPIFTSDYNIIGVHTNGGSNANYGAAICNQLFSTLKTW